MTQELREVTSRSGRSELVAFIAAQSGMAERLLREHTSDLSGRCCVCSSGAQAGRSAWPCTLRRAADAARAGAGEARA